MWRPRGGYRGDPYGGSSPDTWPADVRRKWLRRRVRSVLRGKYSSSVVKTERSGNRNARRGTRRRLAVPLVVWAAALVTATLGCSSVATAGTARVGLVSLASGFGSNWTTYHGNAEATEVHAVHTKLLPSRQAWTSPILDGQLYGEPLVADGRVVAATENDTVYVMAANSGHILWSRHLATAVPSHDLPLWRHLVRSRHYGHPGDRLAAPRDRCRCRHTD